MVEENISHNLTVKNIEETRNHFVEVIRQN